MRSARRELRGVPGNPPDLRQDFPGCPFGPRCEFRFDPCASVHPLLRPPAGRGQSLTAAGGVGAGGAAAGGWQVACHLHDPSLRASGPPPGLDGVPVAAPDAPGAPGAGAGPAGLDSPVGADSAVGADSIGGEA